VREIEIIACGRGREESREKREGRREMGDRSVWRKAAVVPRLDVGSLLLLCA
jgi:hypothetical protein